MKRTTLVALGAALAWVGAGADTVVAVAALMVMLQLKQTRTAWG